MSDILEKLSKMKFSIFQGEPNGLWIPYALVEMEGLKAAQKALLTYVYQFGSKGCWKSNKAVGEFFGVSIDVIKRRLKGISEYICVENPKGSNRIIKRRMKD